MPAFLLERFENWRRHPIWCLDGFPLNRMFRHRKPLIKLGSVFVVVPPFPPEPNATIVGANRKVISSDSPNGKVVVPHTAPDPKTGDYARHDQRDNSRLASPAVEEVSHVGMIPKKCSLTGRSPVAFIHEGRTIRNHAIA